ncbi:hypothetical protein [Phenylobacterium sp.]|uniref:hypothetical protein n=1 Tax=Phenylobacterium sp. TaxID=1871053 RepID=UPI0025E173B9|nr:hypothetical protein [Phenylobacterium sp.]
MNDNDMADVMAALARLQSGDVEARLELMDLWTSAPQASATRRCTLAHFLADTETNPAAELRWDRIALEAATGDASGDADAVTQPLAAFLPSLHLNVGDALRRVGDPELARFHAQAGLGRARNLPADGYGEAVRAALERLLARVS